MAAQLPPDARLLLLPAVAADLYLQALQRRGFDVFSPDLLNGGFSPLWHQLVTKYRMLRRTP